MAAAAILNSVFDCFLVVHNMVATLCVCAK